MKKGLVFILGIITGVILTFVVSLIIASKSSTSGITFFDAPDSPMPFRSVEVFQALNPGGLCHPMGIAQNDEILLLWTNENVVLYDGQRVTVESGKCFRPVGVYRYTTGGGLVRTVPVIAIMSRNETSIPQ